MEKTPIKPKVEAHYDPKTDVLEIYIDWDEPPATVGEYVGGGVVIYYDERTGKVTGVTIIGATQRGEKRKER